MKKLFYLSIILFAVACGDSSTTEERTDGFSKKPTTPEDSLFEEVMHGHDTAMAKMGRITKFRKDVQGRLDSLNKVGGAAKTSLQSSLQELESDLKSAEDGMMKWMEDFSIDSAEDNIEQRLEYLKSEKLKVDDVKNKIFNSLSKADSLLRK